MIAKKTIHKIKLIIILLLPPFLSFCEYPIDLDRDNVKDPKSNAYLPFSPYNVKAEFYDYPIKKISWEDSSLGSITYFVERKINDEDFKHFAKITNAQHHTYDTTSISGSYSYRVSSSTKAGRSDSVISNTLFDFFEGDWFPGPSMHLDNAGQKYKTVVELSDGRILFLHNLGNEIYDHSAKKWIITTSSNTEYIKNAILLSDGCVLAFKGVSYPGFEIYNPFDESWRHIQRASLDTIHDYSLRMVMLMNGDVLVTGVYQTIGDNNQLCEILDLNTESFRPTSKMKYTRIGHSSILLNNGSVLAAGGFLYNDRINTKSVEIFNPSGETWTLIDSMSRGRNYHGSIVLDDGRILVVNGEADAFALPHKTCEIFNSSTNTWSNTAALNYKFIYHLGLVKLTDGKIFTITTNSGEYYTEIYNSDIDQWEIQGSFPAEYLNEPNSISLLPDGDVMATGYNSPHTLIFRYNK